MNNNPTVQNDDSETIGERIHAERARLNELEHTNYEFQSSGQII